MYESGKVDLCSDDLSLVMNDTELVFVTVPSFMFKKTLDDLEQYVYPGLNICLVPGNGGAEFYSYNIRKKGGILHAFERVHVTAKLKSYGKSVRQLSRKKCIRTATMPSPYIKAETFAYIIGKLLSMKCIHLPNFLCASMALSNPVLHTPRLYRVFMDYDGTGYDNELFMYDTWDDLTSEILFGCDDDLQNICKSLNNMDLTSILSLRDYYESFSVSAFTKKMQNISAFHGAKVPMIKRNNRWHPDFNSRLFTADIEYGLQFMKEIGQCCNVATPTMDTILLWYTRISHKKLCLNINGYTKEQLYDFYEIQQL